MSVKIELYQLVKAAVEAIPEVETFGHFNNQFDTEADEQPFNNPAVFFEFSDMPWLPSMHQIGAPQGTQQQKTESAQFVLHISYWSHEEEEDEFLGLLNIVDLVYRAIANIESLNINPIQRINDEDDNSHTEPIVWKTAYSTMLTEQGAAKPSSPVTVIPVVIPLNS